MKIWNGSIKGNAKMNKLSNYQRFMISAFGILSLLVAQGSSAPRPAAKTTNDLSIKIVANRGTARPGQSITYTVTTTNLGPDDAALIDVVHQLPDELTAVALTCDRGISPDGPFCEYSLLESRASVVSTLVAVPKSAHGRKKTVTTTAYIAFETLDTFDPHMRNNKASVRTQLTGR